mgnify:CR=1 FL=1
MTEWVKIDRATGNVLKRRTEDSLERVMNKAVVWIELDKKNAPEYDASTHKLNATVVQPDLSDLSQTVPTDAKRVEGYEAVALSDKEVREAKEIAVRVTDRNMAQITEELMTAIATGKTLNRAAFPDSTWAKINERRKIRGESEI